MRADIHVTDRRGSTDAGRISRRGAAARPSATLSVDGWRLGIRAESPELLDLVRAAVWLPPATRGRVTGSSIAHVFDVERQPEARRTGSPAGLRVSRDGKPVATVGTAAEAGTLIEREVHHLLARSCRDHLFVHSGVVGWQGRAVVLPGRSRSGKSTLVAALVRAGAAYYSDEFAVLDANGLVHPFPKPIRLRRRGAGVRVTAPELGGSFGRDPLPLGLVLVAPYQRGRPWRPTRLSRAECAMALLARTLVARARPGFALDVLQRTVCGAHGYATARGEAERVADRVLRLLEETDVVDPAA